MGRVECHHRHCGASCPARETQIVRPDLHDSDVTGLIVELDVENGTRCRVGEAGDEARGVARTLVSSTNVRAVARALRLTSALVFTF